MIILEVGDKINRLTLIERIGKRKYFVCECECGNILRVEQHRLLSGQTKSCGCYSRDLLKKNRTVHGKRNHRLYSIWGSMKSRCYYKNKDNYKYYGGKGIEVCEEWKNDFQEFYEWAMKNGYKEGLSIDRIDNSKNYKPSNCKFSNQTEQVRNRSNSVWLKYNGENRHLKEWCDIYDINYKLAHARYKKGWSFERVFNIDKEK